ncbi:D-alanyl-D-alanine carboxypeptidase/D-alanyl-D-alanine endopeptidase [Olivibacter sitiensis]|uniref:D-alanyl-D-alanine carboxypeptidase/D-alanyl-D-alanine endopeptidase n=1 Tax=Olivibacter sitiensis TaxID=376470 RepID=UPI000567229B|nr:D-alanyl-D-alanine carboxypeptidase/D-alanyl-D-alanine-endopeptidase [Olivibacter sitiensis]
MYSLSSYAQTLSTKINKAYTAFEQNAQLKYGTLAFTVLNGNTGGVIFENRGRQGMATASTLKTITSAMAFQVLGNDYRYATRLHYSGTVDAQGVLHGHVVLVGSGDPTLGSDRYAMAKSNVLLDRWVAAIKKTGIRSVEGSVLADDGLFGKQEGPPRWVWQDMGSYYGAGISALNWMENKAALTFTVGSQVGDAARLQSVTPDLSYLQFVNHVRTGGKGTGDKVYPYIAPYGSVVQLEGTYGIDLKKTIEMAVPDAAYDVAFRLHDALEKAGIRVSDAPATAFGWKQSGKPFPQVNKLLDEYHSPALKDIVYWFNQKSINLYGEALLKTVAHVRGEDTETMTAAQWMASYWSDQLGFPKEELRIYDGSGLSPENRVTANAMAHILLAVKKEKWYKEYLESFPVYNDMRMKSGTIDGVMGYAGYHTHSSGVPLVFVVLVNNYTGSGATMRQQIFKLLDVLK